ncbi:MAG: rhodanese-like domain-containing protein [Desulfobacterales bacterium]|nr:rhodanese-like domain-containing protein [Desulfobacterales bacterium]
MAESISPQKLQQLLNEREKPCLLDVRRKSDYEAGPQKIETARWKDPENVDQWVDSIPKDRDVVVYCVKGGSVSQSVADELHNRRHRVTFLQGGIRAWNIMQPAQGNPKDTDE